MSRPASWVVLGAATVAAGWLLGRISLPSSYLFAALLLGIAVALRARDPLVLSPPAFSAAQAVTGVVLGAYLQSGALEALGRDWLPVALVSAATLLLTLAGGVALARATELDEPTAALGMIAGGASGIVAMARELGGDDRLVAFMQYVRVLLVVLLTPLLVAVAFPGHMHEPGGAATGGDGPILGDAAGWAITIGAAVAGAALGRATRLPAGILLGPLFVAAGIELGITDFQGPPVLREAGFILIGWQVGLRFTMETIRQAGRLFVPVLVAMTALLVACFGLAVALDATTSVSLLDAYLATTPGGLYAVLAAAVGAGANTTFIVAVQGLRLLVMVLLAPAAVRLLHARRRVAAQATVAQ